jgi:hypothetical protein
MTAVVRDGVGSQRAGCHRPAVPPPLATSHPARGSCQIC